MTRVLTVMLALALLVPATSQAFSVQSLDGVQSGTNGIALGPDGNFWVAEQFANSLARISPSGQVVARYMLSGEPHAVATGPGDRVWVAVNSTKQLVWFDAKAATPTAHTVTLPADCPPDGLAAANNRMYFGCGAGLKVGFVADDGSGVATTAAAGGGAVFDLAAVDGKLFAPDFDNSVVRRLNADLGVGTTIGVTAGSAPDGVTSNGTDVWVTLNASGKLARFPVGQAGGNATEVSPPAGMLLNPFGLVFGDDGRLYVASKDGHRIVRFNADGTNPQAYDIPEAEPFDIVRGPDSDLWATDNAKSRLLRLVNAAPRVTTNPTTVDPRGNDTTVVYDYGPTTSYGQTTAPFAVPSGVTPVPVPLTLQAPAGSTYHVRARATNAEGETLGEDFTITTVPGPQPTPAPTKVAAKVAVKVKVNKKKRTTTVRSVTFSGLLGTETATIRCTGRKCPFKKRVYKLKKGKRTFGKSLFKGRKLRKGVVITVQLSAPGKLSTTTRLTVRRGRKPTVRRT